MDGNWLSLLSTCDGERSSPHRPHNAPAGWYFGPRWGEGRRSSHALSPSSIPLTDLPTFMPFVSPRTAKIIDCRPPTAVSKIRLRLNAARDSFDYVAHVVKLYGQRPDEVLRLAVRQAFSHGEGTFCPA